MTSPTQRPTISPEATRLLLWLAAGSPLHGNPPFVGDQPAFSAAIDELHRAGLARRTANDGAWTASNAGLEEAARLEEEAARRKAAEEPPPDSTRGAIPIVFDKNASPADVVHSITSQLLQFPAVRKVVDAATDRIATQIAQADTLPHVHLSPTALAEALDQLDLYLEGDREPLLYLGPILVALLDQTLPVTRTTEQNERLDSTRERLMRNIAARTPDGRAAVDRWVKGNGAAMRGEDTK